MAKTGKSKKTSKVSETQRKVAPVSPKDGFNTGPLESPSEEMDERSDNYRTTMCIDLKYLREWGINLGE